MKPVMCCRKIRGMRRWAQSSMKCAPLLRRFAHEDAVVGDDAHGVAVQARETGHQRIAIQLLELVELRAIDDARDDLAYVEGLPRIRGDDAVQLRRVVQRLPRRLYIELLWLAPVEAAHGLSRELQRVVVVTGEVIRDPGLAAVHVGAAQFLGGDDFAGGGLHQGRAGKEDRALFLHDDGFVRHRRYVGTARGA
jgi:hypothetical protein